MDKETHSENGNTPRPEEVIHEVINITGLYENWFLEYASYVILERAVPAIGDGLKPVQRRILHAMKEMDDGRFNKVANIIGSTMQYHPHGDASISDAIVGLGQKDLLIDTQGNWGDIRTGDGAAAPRYIEARLSHFALEVLFNPQTTGWQLSYDGRKKEPVNLPVKFPLLLAQGVEGIAVGLSTKILPHNFCELLQACIELLEGREARILPDFPTGGLADFSDYNAGMRGGKVRVRARIEEMDKKTLVIRDIPFGTTTTSLIESIVKASEKGKIKIRKVVDNTAKDVEIQIHLAPGQSPDIATDALYAFTDCEISISPNACVIVGEKPRFLSVYDILQYSNDQTLDLLRRELEIKRLELLEKILFGSLEKIFIENRIYRDIEECETWEAVISTIDQGLEPYKSQFYREITEEDIVRLTEIKIKRISRFDAFKADELLKKLQEGLRETDYNLAHLVEYAVNYYRGLLERYGAGRERRTEIRAFDTIQANVVAATNAKLYINREDGFVGHGLRRDEYICDCSDLDDVIVIRRDGKMVVTRISEKTFVGKGILYAGIFKKNDERMVYNMVYHDGESGRSLVKRFQVLGITRDKEYDLTKGGKGSQVLYLTANPNGEAETINVNLSSRCRAKIKVFDYDFSQLDVKGRSAGGNILTRYPVKKIQLKQEGRSTLGGMNLYFDESIGRLNRDGRGRYLGNFSGGDVVLAIYREGSYELTGFELTSRYEPEHLLYIGKFNPDSVITAVHTDGSTGLAYVKRFRIETTTLNKRFVFIGESKGSRLHYASLANAPQVVVELAKKKSTETLELNLAELIDVKGWKAMGNRLSLYPLRRIIPAETDDTGESAEEDGIEHAEEADAPDAGNSGSGDAHAVAEESEGSGGSEESARPGPPEKVRKPGKRRSAKPETGQPGEEAPSETFHIGDTVEFKINPPKPGQLDLFDA
jgi:topoisomerase IV subunit A